MFTFIYKTCLSCGAALVLFSGLMVGGCEKRPDKNQNTINVWFHTGTPAEKNVIEDQVARFNASQGDIKVHLTLIPEGDYNTQIQAAAADERLPDVLDIDGPYLANYAWKGHLVPIDKLIGDDIQNDLLPSIITQGTYHGHLYAVGTFDSGLGLYANKKLLDAARIDLPAKNKPWPIKTFESHLRKLAELDDDGKVLDLRLDYRGEWFTYAFSPIIQSAGGDLLDRSTRQTAQSFLNGPDAVRAMRHIQKWFNKGYIDPNIDTSSFINGRVAFSWCGHWEYPRYKKALGDNLVLLPLPDFGNGSKTAMGSWCWAVTKNCKNPVKAIRFVRFLLQPTEILAMCRANGAVPASRTAVAASLLYGKDGPLRLFFTRLQSAVPRPRSPAYPVITSAFQQAFQDIRHGVEVQRALDAAVEIIDQDIKDNLGYPDVKPID